MVANSSMSTVAAAKQGTSQEFNYHAQYHDPAGNIIVKSEDDVYFRTYDYFLKASSSYFRDMLDSSTNPADNIIPLPESSEDICSLLKILNGTAGRVQDFPADIKISVKLFSLTSKYQIIGACHKWIACLLIRFLREDPLECFAAACEHVPMDQDIAEQAIRLFPSPAVTQVTASSRRCYASYYDCGGVGGSHLDVSYRANPALWDTVYIQRLGLLNFSAYVSAWNSCYLISKDVEKDIPGALVKLADTFCANLQKW